MIVNFADWYPGNGSDSISFSVRRSGREAPERGKKKPNKTIKQNNPGFGSKY